MSVCSLHKTLGGPWWGTAVVMNNKNSKISEQRFMQAHRALSTSSRSWGPLFDLESTVVSMEENKGEWMQGVERNMKKILNELRKVDNIILFNQANHVSEYDRTKFIFGIKGMSMELIIEEFHRVESQLVGTYASDYGVLMQIPVNITDDEVDDIIARIKVIAKRNKHMENNLMEDMVYANLIQNRNIVMPIKEVWAQKTETIPIGEAVGRISADCIRPCPPGFPFIFYGETIKKQNVQLLGEDRMVEVIAL